MRVGGRKILPKLEENESAAKPWAQTTRLRDASRVFRAVSKVSPLNQLSVAPVFHQHLDTDCDYFDKQGVRHSFIFSAVGHKLKKEKKN